MRQALLEGLMIYAFKVNMAKYSLDLKLSLYMFFRSVRKI